MNGKVARHSRLTADGLWEKGVYSPYTRPKGFCDPMMEAVETDIQGLNLNSLAFQRAVWASVNPVRKDVRQT